MRTTQEPAAASLRTTLPWIGASFVAYVGLVHEVVGARLYPDGPALLGGPLPWHALGLAGIAAGATLLADLLGVVRVPRRALAAVVGVAGAGAVVMDLVVHDGFHFFGATIVVAALLVALGPARAATDRRA
jgi:hypothetical protein